MVKPLAKILLINPVTRNGQKVLRIERCQQKLLRPVGIWPPVALLEVSASLKYRGFENIEIIDGEIENLSFDELVQRTVKKFPDMVIIQATTPTVEDDILFSSLVKRHSGGTLTVFIGLHATVFPNELLRKGPIDYVVLGEPDKAIPELAEYCFKNQGDIRKIKGLGYKNNGSVFVNERGLPRDDYDYPIVPDRALLKNDRYIMPLTGKPFAVIKVSRGCNFSCSFCTSSLYYGKGWRARSPENIIEEIKDVKEKFGINTFLFLSDTFNSDNNFVEKLSSLIIENNLNIKWVANSRVDLISENTVVLMKKAGCLLVSLGIESYDEDILRKNKKNLDRKAITRGIDILKKHGITTYGYFIFGLENESKMSMLKTIFAAASSKLDFAVFYSLTPYPGTPYFKRFNNLNWKDYFHGSSNIAEYSNLGRRTIKIGVYIALVIFYLRPRRILSLVRYILKGKLC